MIMDEMACEVCVVADATTWTEVETEEPLAGELMLTLAKVKTEDASTVRNRLRTLRKLTSEKFGVADEWRLSCGEANSEITERIEFVQSAKDRNFRLNLVRP
jgi:hypothetical protein